MYPSLFLIVPNSVFLCTTWELQGEQEFSSSTVLTPEQAMPGAVWNDRQPLLLPKESGSTLLRQMLEFPSHWTITWVYGHNAGISSSLSPVPGCKCTEVISNMC